MAGYRSEVNTELVATVLSTPPLGTELAPAPPKPEPEHIEALRWLSE